MWLRMLEEVTYSDRLLEYYISTSTFRDQVNAQGSTNYAAIRPQHVLDYTIPLPPLDEQKRIVDRVETLNNRIEEARHLHEQTTRYVDLLLAAARAAAFKIRESWSVACVADFCEQPQYGYTESAVSDPIGPRFLRITDIQNGHVNWNTVPFCPCPNPGPYLLRKGDIVFARTGATTGKSFLIKECPEAVFASYLIRLRVKQSVSPEYLHQYFQSPSYWLQIIDAKKGTGQPNVNGKKLAKIIVPIPSPDEQQQIVQYLTNLDRKMQELKLQQIQSGKELDSLLPSILNSAFKGEL